MAKKRILEFSTYAKIGGTQQMLLEFLRHASRDRYEFSLAVLLGHDVLNEDVSKLNIENISFNMRGYWDLTAWWKLYKFANGKQFDLIRTYGLKADIIGRIVGRLLKIPVNVTSVRSTDPWRKCYHVLLDIMTSGLTDLYLSNSEAGRMAVHQRERISLAKIKVIPNGVDLTKFVSRAFNGDEYRQRFGISSHACILGMVANLCKMKGHTTIVDALPQIQREIPDITCLFVGSDFLGGAIQRYVRDKQLQDKVIFTGFRQDIPEILSICDLFVLSSQWEGMPTVLLEAMAMKLPVIATNVGGIPEIVIHGETGLLIPPDNPLALAEAVVSLYKNPELASKMGQAGYNRVKTHFPIESVIAKTEALYDCLIEQKQNQ